MYKWHRLPIPFLIIALIVSLAVNFSTYERSQKYFSLYEQTILDPMGMNYYLPRDKPEVPEGKELVVFLGDSRAQAWPAPQSDRFVFTNRGIGGQTSAQVLGRFSDDIPVLGPDIIVIQVGINDLTTIPTFPKQQRKIISQCKRNLQELTKQSEALGAIVIITTIFPIRNTFFTWQTFASDEVANGIEEVNQFIHSLTGEKVIVMDTSQILAESSGSLNSEYSLDTLHINAKGYDALNASLSVILENTSNGRQSQP